MCTRSMDEQHFSRCKGCLAWPKCEFEDQWLEWTLARKVFGRRGKKAKELVAFKDTKQNILVHINHWPLKSWFPTASHDTHFVLRLLTWLNFKKCHVACQSCFSPLLSVIRNQQVLTALAGPPTHLVLSSHGMKGDSKKVKLKFANWQGPSPSSLRSQMQTVGLVVCRRTMSRRNPQQFDGRAQKWDQLEECNSQGLHLVKQTSEKTKVRRFVKCKFILISAVPIERQKRCAR